MNGCLQDYLAQILAGLNAIHAGDLVHRGMSLSHFLGYVVEVAM